jgi:magnesium-transporting ATPase (P-type)
MLPKFVGRFFRDDFSNYVMSRMLMILGMLFVTFDLSMAISIADMFTLGIVQAMFTLMYIINWGIYISMIVVLYITILKSLEMWNTKKQNKRNGIDENFEG